VDLGLMLRLSRRGRALFGRLGLAAADPLLLLPARLVRRKRIELAITAAASLRRRGRRARLLVTGGPDPHDPDASVYLAELRALVAEAGDHDVLLLDVIGRSADDRMVADLYAFADAMILPSSSEGFGLPVVEAAVNRLPIVCTDLAVFRSLAGPAATYVPVEADGHAWADAIEEALATSPAAGLAGRVRRELDWQRIVPEQVIPAILG
jgi:glycosyltransferase involved in cell wall biosynthesis